jgi:hypothetical protein
LTTINKIGSGLAACILQRLGNDKSETLSQQKTQNTAIELPKSVLPAMRTSQLPLPRHRVLWLIVRKQAIDEQGVDDNEDQWETAGYAYGIGHGDAFMYGVRILDGDVVEGEVLVVRLNRVENGEAGNAGTVFVSTE